MIFRIRTMFAVLAAVLTVGLCAALPSLASRVQDRRTENTVGAQSIRDLSMTVQAPGPFEKLVLASDRMNPAPFPESRAQHTPEEIYYTALKYFVRYQEAGLVAQDYSISDYDCAFRMHSYDQLIYNNFWHINLYCRPGIAFGDDAPLFSLSLTIDDATENVYNIWYTESEDIVYQRPVADPTLVVQRLSEVFAEDLKLADFTDYTPSSLSQLGMGDYCNGWLELKCRYPAEGTPGQPQTGLDWVVIELYATDVSYYIEVNYSESSTSGEVW